MARTFVTASTTQLEVSSAPVTGPPATMMCWFKTTRIDSTEQIYFSVGDANVNDEYFQIGSINDDLNIRHRTTGTLATANHFDTMTTNTWFHAAGVFTSATSRTVYLNGDAGTTNTTSVTSSGFDTTRIGRKATSGGAFYADADIAECAIWNVALSASEVLSLSKGVSPWSVRPGSLVFYVPVFGVDSPERDLSGNGYHMTLTNSPAAANHAPVSPYLYVPERWARQVEAAAAGTNPRRRALLGVGV